MLCFGVPKANGDPASAPAEVPGSVRPRHSRSSSGSAQPEFIRRSRQLAQELKDLLLHIGVQPTVVTRDSLVINMECIQEEKSGLVRAGLGSSSGQHQACAAIPELAEGNGTSVPRRPRTDSPRLPPASAPPPRSFVRVQSIHHQLPGAHADPPGGMRTPSASPSSFSIADRIIEDVREEEDEATPSPGEQPTPSKRGLNWTASRRALAVLVVREEHLSRTDKGLQNLSHSRRLEDRLERLNLDMLTMDGDGNCQFRTLAHELYGSQEHHPQVRARVMQHIRDNKEEYECFLGEDFGTYVTSMSRSCTWGDELTLRAACDAYGIMVCVVTSDAQKWFLTYEPKVLDESHGGGELFLAYIAPIHYNAIRRKPSLRTLSKQLSSSFKRLAMSGSLHT